MANKPLQSIQFPGLPDKYTVPQMDSNFDGVSGKVPDSKKVHDEISSLKEDFNSVVNVDSITINPIFVAGKNISSQGYVVNNSKRIATEEYIIVDGNDIVYSINDGYRMYGAFYDNSKTFLSNFGDWITGSGTITTPNNAVYLRIGFASVGDETTLTVQDAENLTLMRGYPLLDALNSLNFSAMQYKGAISSTGAAQYLDDVYGQGLYNIQTGNTPTDAPTGFRSGLLIVFRAYTKISATLNIYQTVQMLIDVANKVVFARYCNTSNVWRDWWEITAYVAPVVKKTKWLAVGDSITYGVYSYITSNETASSGVTDSCWVKLLASSLGYDLTVMASRGLGYAVTGQDPEDSSLPRITLDTLLTRIEALTGDFNLITLALGINDYATNYATIANIKASLSSAIARLVTRFPTARLVVITPFNSAREGDANTNFAYGSAIGGRTLKDVADAIKEQCQEYGVECVYATNGFLFNNYNIEGLEPDKTHPSLDGHKLIAKNMAHILYY